MINKFTFNIKMEDEDGKEIFNYEEVDERKENKDVISLIKEIFDNSETDKLEAVLKERFPEYANRVHDNLFVSKVARGITNTVIGVLMVIVFVFCLLLDNVLSIATLPFCILETSIRWLIRK